MVDAVLRCSGSYSTISVLMLVAEWGMILLMLSADDRYRLIEEQ